MNVRLLLKVLGWIAVLVAGAMLACEVYALASGDAGSGEPHDFALLKSFAITGCFGAVLLVAGRGSGNEILRKEAIAIVGLGWLVSAFAGALPYLLCTPALGPAEALFESASGFTTTGASVIADLDRMPRPILLWRSTTQWLGGMGILVLFVALLSNLGAGSKSLFLHESSAKTGFGFHSRIRQTALRLWQIYAGLTVLCVAGLMGLGMSLYDAVLHAFSAISTGGFSPCNASVGGYASAAIDAWICLFMALGGTSFLLMAWILRGGWAKAAGDEELRAYGAILFAAIALVTLDLVWHAGESFPHGLRLASFQVISIMTTTGFATADFAAWPEFSQAALVLLMAAGGCAGSTSGGIKISRIVIFFKAARQQILASFRPGLHLPVKFNARPLDDGHVTRVLFFVALTGVVIALSTLVLAALEPSSDLLSTFTAVVASLFNIGPGLGEVGPTKNFAHFSGGSKCFLAALMVVGRLEFFGVLALFVPALWKKY
jgi:trk system potassium uptake protein